MTMIGKVEYNTSTTYTQPPVANWVDLSTWLRWNLGVTVTRGRTDEASAVTPSRLTLVLDNVDGRFTPGNTSSPLYPTITVPCWIRFTLVDASLGISSVRFTGLVDSWKPDVAGANSAKVVNVSASDVLQHLSRFRDLRSTLHEEVLQDVPIAFYPMDDGDDALSFADQSGNLQPPLQILSIGATGSISPGGTDGPPATGAKAPNFTPDLVQGVSNLPRNGHGKYLLTNLSNGLTVGNGHPYTIEWWMKLNQQAANPSYNNGTLYVFPGLTLLESPASNLSSRYGGIYQTAFGLIPPDPGAQSMYGDGHMILQLGTSVFGTQPPNGQSGALNPGIWYHFACVSDGGSTTSSAKFFMNGHFMGCTGVTYPPDTLPAPPAGVRDLTYMVLAGLPVFGGDLLDGSVAYAALYESALSQPRLLSHYLAGRNGFHGETLRTRLVRLLNYAGLGDQTANANVEESLVPVIPQGNGKALSLVNQLEVTEQGMFFIDAAGLPAFYNRSHRYVSPLLTLDATEIANADLQPILDDQRLLNDVTTTTGLGTKSRATDGASILTKGYYQRDVATVAASPTNGDETSRWIINGRSQALLRWPSIRVDLLTQPTIRAAVLAAKPLDRLTLSNLPAEYVFGTTAIEGWSEAWGVEEQAMVFNVTPNVAPPATVYTIGVAGSDEVDTSSARLGF